LYSNKYGIGWIFGIYVLVLRICHTSLVAKPQIFGEPCNTVRTKLTKFVLLFRDVFFKNLNNATLSSLGNPQYAN